jgi:GSH-dependent disulfide-bond oxidoreductase
MPMIELYGMSSPNVRKVGIMLEELGAEYRLRHVAVFRGDQFQPEFLAMNPLGKVPVLVDPERGAGQPTFASYAPLFFLPAAGAARYEVMEWLMVQMASIGPMFGQYNHFNILGAQADAYATARYRTQAERLYRVLDDRLAGHEWVAGGSYSIADMAIYPWAHYLERHGFDRAAHPSLLKWRDKIEARPAVKRSWDRFSEAFDRESAESIRTVTPKQLDDFFWRDPTAPAADYSAVKSMR